MPWLRRLASCLTIFVTTTLPGVELPFGPSTILSGVSGQWTSMEAADLFGDGLPDLVACSRSLGRFDLWRSEGGMLVWEVAFGFASSPGNCALAIGDLDGDGWKDVLVALDPPIGAGTDLAWSRNPGGDGAWVHYMLPPIDGGVHDIALGDFDGDGDLDIAGSAITAGSYSFWMENDGSPADGGWSLHTALLTGGEPSALIAADLDRDGDLDLACTDTASNGVYLLLNPRDLVDWEFVEITLALHGASAVAAGDVDRDGDAELVALGHVPERIAVYEPSLGDAGSAEPSENPAATGWGAVRLQDLDFDGDLDALSAGYGNSLYWHENIDGHGNFGARSIAAYAVRDAVAADFDGDGDLDLASANENTGSVFWKANRLIHRRFLDGEPHTVASGRGDPRDVEVGDLDGEGSLDVAVAEWGGDTISVFYDFDGTGGLWWRDDLTTTFDGARDVALADLNGDGKLDVIASAVFADRITWWENGGPLTWTEHTVLTGLDGAHRAVPADFDGDGDVDLVVAGYYEDEVRLLLNWDGLGTSWNPRVFASYDGPFDLAAGDLDHDGRIDFVADYYDEGMIRAYLNGEALWTSSAIATGLDGPRGIALGDFDADGDLDVVVLVRNSDEVLWFENDLGGAGWIAHDVGTGFFDDGASVRAADLDHDGDVDVAAAGNAGDDVYVWLNGGGGTSWTRREVETSLDAPWAVAIGDIDRDGRVDLVVGAGGTTDSVLWYPNLGGQFSSLVYDEAPSQIGGGERDVVFSFILSHQGRIGWDADLELASLDLGLTDAAGAPLTQAQAEAVIARLEIYQDTDRDAFFDPLFDLPVASIEELPLVAGSLAFAVPDDLASAATPPETAWRYFLTLTAERWAGNATPHVVRLAIPASGLHAEDRAFDLPLEGEARASLTTDPITLGDPGTVFIDGFESGDASQWSTVNP